MTTDNELGNKRKLPAQALMETIAPLKLRGPAEAMYGKIAASIIAFEKKLDATTEVGARLVNFGGGEAISIDDVGFWGERPRHVLRP